MPRKQKSRIRGPKPCSKHKKLGEYIPDCVDCWFDTAWEPWLGKDRTYWGTF